MAHDKNLHTDGVKKMKNMEGQKVPNVTFKTRDGDSWCDVTTDELFKGQKVVLFALPDTTSLFRLSRKLASTESSVFRSTIHLS